MFVIFLKKIQITKKLKIKNIQFLTLDLKGNIIFSDDVLFEAENFLVKVSSVGCILPKVFSLLC